MSEAEPCRAADSALAISQGYGRDRLVSSSDHSITDHPCDAAWVDFCLFHHQIPTGANPSSSLNTHGPTRRASLNTHEPCCGAAITKYPHVPTAALDAVPSAVGRSISRVARTTRDMHPNRLRSAAEAV